MDKAKLIKWDDKECQSRGWEGGIKQLAEETGYEFEFVRDLWWIDDENIEWDVQPGTPIVGEFEELTGYIIIRDRIYPTTVDALVVSVTDQEIVFYTPDANMFF
jgi:hypothetical protein